MDILTVTSLYPNAEMPAHGVFVENRLRHLMAAGGIRLRVVAPVPWFPFGSPRFGAYGRYARVPRREVRHGIDVAHPRYVVLPRIGMILAPALMYACLRRHVGRLLARGASFDLIDAHYFYPDGVAAALLGRATGRPVVITGRGTDLNLFPRYALPRRMIRWAARRAAGLVTVSAALKGALVELGIAADKVKVLRNGVDLDIFRPPADRAAFRQSLGLPRPTLLSVGHLIERKGHDLVIRALEELTDFDLVIVGTGPERGRLEALARAIGVAGRVRFAGAVDHAGLAVFYGAADALVLASSREGWANVLLEAMACGTPVVASAIWGTPEVVAAPEAGVLMDVRSPAGVAEGVRRLMSALPDRAATRRYAEGFAWDATTRGQLELFGRILAARGRTQAAIR